MTGLAYRLTPLRPDLDLAAFDCGEDAYNTWLTDTAAQAHASGTAHVTVLLEGSETGSEKVVGYFAICPTRVVRDEMPKTMRRRMPRGTPGWLLAKLALDRSLRGRPEQWGRQLLREALVTIVEAAEHGGGAVIVVDADNPGLVPYYEGNGFVSTGGPGPRLYMKVATARAYLAETDGTDAEHT